MSKPWPKASIDIGSNSILLLILDQVGGEYKVLVNESNITGLGRYLDKNGAFLEIAMQESREVLLKYRSICDQHKIEPKHVMITATEATRVAGNAKEFIQDIKNKTDLDIITITGEAEAYFSTQGILFDSKINQEEVVIMDIGGASTELIKVRTQNKEILQSFSMPIGAVRMNNWIEEDVLDQKMGEVYASFSEGLDQMKTSKLFCVAGTMTSVGNMFLNNKKFEEDEVNGLEFDVHHIDKMFESYSDFSVEEFNQKFPFLGKRARTIKAGILLARSICQRLGIRSVYISTYGQRYGTILLDEIEDKYVFR